MDKLGWQSLIFITIVLALFLRYFFQKKTSGKQKFTVKALPAITIGGWVLWTLLATFSTTLLVEQLRTIGVVGLLGTLILWWVTKTENENDQLKAAMQDASDIKNPNFDEAIVRERARKDAEANAIAKIYPVNGLANLKAELNSALETAQDRVLIMSGWASRYVIDEQFIQRCIKLLESKAELHIGFGYDSSSDKKMPDWEKEGRRQIGKLMKIALKKEIDDRLFIYEFDNHYKSLVKDNDYFLTGSFNWLSNSKGKNFERAWKNEFSELAEKEFNECVAIMRPKKVILRRKLLKPFLEWSDD